MTYAYGKMKMKKTMHVVWLFQTVWKKGTIYKSIILFGWLGCSAVKHHMPSKRSNANLNKLIEEDRDQLFHLNPTFKKFLFIPKLHVSYIGKNTFKDGV